MAKNSISKCFLLVTALALTKGCAVVKTDNVSSFHTAELCLYLYSPHEVAGWQVDSDENRVISNELMLRGFTSRLSRTAFLRQVDN